MLKTFSKQKVSSTIISLKECNYDVSIEKGERELRELTFVEQLLCARNCANTYMLSYNLHDKSKVILETDVQCFCKLSKVS